MELDSNLLKDFARVTNDQSSGIKMDSTVKGTVVVVGGTMYVRFDGSDILTPVEKAMDAADGDRVIVTIKNHTATITGNITSPASARTATSFMNLTDEGLVIGALDGNGRPVGSSSLIGPGTYYIVDALGRKVASFSANQIKLGESISSEIVLCNGKGLIQQEYDTLRLQGEDAVGLQSIYNDYKAEVVAKAIDDKPVAVLQAYKNYDGTKQSYVKASMDGIELRAPKGKKVTYNGSEVLTSNGLLVAGCVIAKGTLAPGKSFGFLPQVDVPEGYYLTGIRQITTNHHTSCVITAIATNPSTGRVGCRVRNVGKSYLGDLQVTMEWFALRTKANDYDITNTVEWSDTETDDEQ